LSPNGDEDSGHESKRGADGKNLDFDGCRHGLVPPSGSVERRSDRELTSHTFKQFTLEALTKCKYPDTIQQFQMTGKRPEFLRKIAAIA
jgi:hypothetical protein